MNENPRCPECKTNKDVSKEYVLILKNNKAQGKIDAYLCERCASMFLLENQLSTEVKIYDP